MPTLSCAARRVPGRDPEEGPGDTRYGGQDENSRGTASRLPETHRRPEGISLRQGRALQYVAG